MDVKYQPFETNSKNYDFKLEVPQLLMIKSALFVKFTMKGHSVEEM